MNLLRSNENATTQWILCDNFCKNFSVQWWCWNSLACELVASCPTVLKIHIIMLNYASLLDVARSMVCWPLACHEIARTQHRTTTLGAKETKSKTFLPTGQRMSFVTSTLATISARKAKTKCENILSDYYDLCVSSMVRARARVWRVSPKNMHKSFVCWLRIFVSTLNRLYRCTITRIQSHLANSHNTREILLRYAFRVPTFLLFGMKF